MISIRSARRLAVVASSLGLVLASAGTASAHVVYRSDESWSNTDSSKCLYNRAEVSHGKNNTGYVRADATASKDAELWPADCTAPWTRPKGDLGSRLTVFKWSVDDEGKGEWIKCMDSPWIYSPEDASRFFIYSHAPVDITWCGYKPEWYNTVSFASVNYGGEWHGWQAQVASGKHLLPATESKAAQPEPPELPWVNEDGTVDPSKVPDRVKVAGPDGKPVVDEQGSPITVPFVEPPSGTGRSDSADGRTTTVTRGADGAKEIGVEVELKPAAP
ncbi:hypothetical protein [Streptomyces sp. NPDC002851]